MDYIIAILYIAIFIMFFIDSNRHGEREKYNSFVKYLYPACVLLFIFNRFTYIPKFSDILLVHIVIEILNLVLLAVLLFLNRRENDHLKKVRYIFCLLAIFSGYHIIHIVLSCVK